MAAQVQTISIRPARLNIKPTEGYAWNLRLTLMRATVPLDLTGAVVQIRFLASNATTETVIPHVIAAPATGIVSFGQVLTASGKYVIDVTEVGATKRAMVRGQISPEAVF